MTDITEIRQGGTEIPETPFINSVSLQMRLEAIDFDEH
jgi:hypothetical protein